MPTVHISEDQMHDLDGTILCGSSHLHWQFLHYLLPLRLIYIVGEPAIEFILFWVLFVQLFPQA